MSAAKSSAACSDGAVPCRASANIRSKSRRACRWRSPAATLTAKGKLGELQLPLTEHVETKVEGNHVTVTPRTEEQQARMMWGTTRALVASMVKGVSTGFVKSMEITGTGYRAAVQGKNLEIEPRLLPSDRLSDPGRASRSPASGRPRSRWKVSTSAWSARWQPRSARFVRPSPTRARACATPTRRSAARKARRSNERKLQDLRAAPA